MVTRIRKFLIWLVPLFTYVIIAITFYFIIQTGIRLWLLGVFLLTSLVALMAESALANLTKDKSFKGTLHKTCCKVLQDQNGPHLLILSVKYAALTTAGLVLTAIVTDLSNQTPTPS